MKPFYQHFKGFLLIASIVVLSSCRTLNLVELTPENRNNRLLPALNSEIDLSVVESMNLPSNVSTTEFVSDDSSFIDEYASVVRTVTEQVYWNPTSNDLLTLFNRDIKYNITEPYGEKKGTIVCRVAGINFDESGFGLSFISVCSFGLLNLVGLPFAMNDASVDIDVDIYDNKSELIGSYHAIGNARIASAMYYGYQVSSAKRLAKIKAFKRAMNDIKSQIEMDYNELSASLK